MIGQLRTVEISVSPKELQVRIARIELLSLLGDIDHHGMNTIKSALSAIGQRLDRALGENNAELWKEREAR